MPPPPRCDNCGKPMRHLLSLPAMDHTGKTVSVFHCKACDRHQWVEH